MLTVVDEPVAEGARAARWRQGAGESYVLLPRGQADWTPFSALVLWVYAARPQGRLTIDVVSGGDTGFEHYFEVWNNIDWSGWKEIRLPIDGPRTRFSGFGKPEWSRVSSIRLWKDEAGPIDIVIDDVRLERKISR